MLATTCKLIQHTSFKFISQQILTNLFKKIRSNSKVIRECLKSNPKEDLRFVLNFVQIAASNLFSDLKFQLRLEFSHEKRNLGHI